jgi:hypothetical protein
MRNAFGVKQEGTFGFGAEFEPDYAERAVSPDQLAVVWNSDGNAVVASVLPNAAPGTSRTDVARFPADFDPEAVNLRRIRELELPPTSDATHYLTVVDDYLERTRILALDGERLALDDADLLEWLINAEKQMVLGTDNHPVFETPLEDTACCIRRLPNGQISITEVPRQHVQATAARIRAFAGGGPISRNRLHVETSLRCLARYFLTATGEGSESLRADRRSEVTAFLLVTRSGYCFGLWSPQVGLFREDAFLAPDQISQKGRGRINGGLAGSRPKGSVDKNDDLNVDAYIKHAFDQLLLEMSPEKLENLQLSNYAQVVWATESSLSEVMAPIADKFAAQTGLQFYALNLPAETAVANGLLLGSYSFGEPTIAGAEYIPPVNLAHDILAIADTEEIQRLREEEARQQNRRNRAVMTMMAAPVIVIACLFALVASLLASGIINSFRDASAEARTLELKPALDRRRSYEANLGWYQEFIKEVSRLRQQQPVGIDLLYQLNANYPFDIDPTFYVSDMKLSPSGDVELKGLARNKDAIAAFLKALEFASGPESGSRLFSNLAYEIQEIAPTTADAGTAKPPTIPGSTLTGTATAAPGAVRWSIKGNYLPVAEFAPKPPAAGQPGAPAQPAQTQNPPVAPATTK